MAKWKIIYEDGDEAYSLEADDYEIAPEGLFYSNDKVFYFVPMRFIEHLEAYLME